MAKQIKTATTDAAISAATDDGTITAGITDTDVNATKSPTKIEQVLTMLRREDGATLDRIVAATGWLPHTARAMLTGLRKKGHSITSTKSDGPRVYRVINTQSDTA